MNFSSIPDEMKSCPNWVCHKNKVPHSPYCKVAQLAKANSPATWGTYEQAVKAYETGQYDGIGFVFSEYDPFCGIDIDHCIDEEDVISDFALNIIAGLNSYTEVSLSGTGIHIIGEGHIPEGGNRAHGVEMYDKGRFFTVTGNVWPGFPDKVRNIQNELERLHRFLFPPKTPRKASPLPSFSDSDATILEKAMSAKNGHAFSRLWRGEWQGAYPSQSEADAALCSHLAYWCGNDTMQMDRLFRASGLMREKWDRPTKNATYGFLTMARAISN